MSWPRITLITPSFNQGNFIEETIRSVVEQQYPNLQYLIFDGASNDQSVEIIKKYSTHISYWESKKDKGQSAAINSGLRMADGEIISWLNSDDFLEKNALFKLAEAFENKEINSVIGKISYFNEDGARWKSRNVVKNNTENTVAAGVVPQPAMYFRKQCYDKVGLLSEQLDFTFDADWYVRYLMHYGISGIREIPDTVVNFRLHKDSKTRNNRFGEERNSIFRAIAQQNGCNAISDILEKLYDYVTDFKFVSPDIKAGISIEKILNYHLLCLGREFYATNNREKARLCFSAIKESLLDPESLNDYKKLKFRNFYFPLSLVKLLRRRTNGRK